MRPIPPGLAVSFGEGTTTLCRCWTLTRRDGVRLGFTDHDHDLVLDGVVHAAGTGLDAAEATAELGFTVGGGDVRGALSSDAVAEHDVRAGLFDDATVVTTLVDWTDPDVRMPIATASIGEIRRADGAFVAELRGPMHRLDEVKGRVFGRTCSADLGDGRCRVDLGRAAFGVNGTVSSTDGDLTVRAAGLAGFADGFFTGGRLVWTGGANAGLAFDVRVHRGGGPAGPALDLWERTARAIGAGDAFRITAGCDKRLSTCRATFDNVPNFRGFPHMPGNDFVLKVARSGADVFDGGSLFR